MKGMPTLFFILTFIPLNAKNNDPLSRTEEQATIESMQIVREIPTTPVRDQYQTNTCWSFSGISLLETELIRLGKGEIDLSEMFIVRQNYERKADRYVRMHGKMNFAPGGEVNDVTDVIARYGILPESVYSGLKIDEKKHIHSEMDKVLEKYVHAIIQKPDKELSNVWMEGMQKVLDTYLGELPETFIYEGTQYTPESFARFLGLEMDNYIMITSFTHQPFYKPFILEIPDNWSWGKSYNVPLDELVQVVDSAIYNNYSVAWATDISEPGFSYSNGKALAPEIVYAPRSKRMEEKWKEKNQDEKEKILFQSRKPVIEIDVTPEIRQNAFNNYSTTDDHGMHIVGIAEDRDGKSYYYVKNSWGNDNPYCGYLYVSKAYFKYKTISIMVHKEALPVAVAKKLGF